MKRIIKISSIIFAAVLMISFGVYAAITAYTWSPTASVEFKAESVFVTVKNLSYRRGQNMGATFSKDSTTSGGTDNAAGFKSYDSLTAPKADAAVLLTWSPAQVVFTQINNVICFQFTVVNDGEKPVQITVTRPTNPAVPNGVDFTGGATDAAANVAVGTNDTHKLTKGQSVKFGYYWKLSIFHQPISVTNWSWNISIVETTV